MLGRGRLLQHLVVKDGTALIQGDNGVIGQLLLTLAAGGEEGELDLEFRGAGLVGAGSGEVAAGAQQARLAQARELIGRFGCAAEIEVPDEVRRIDVADAPRSQFLRANRPETRCARRLGRQKPTCLVQVAARVNLEVPGPVAPGQRRGLVPVILGLVEGQQRPAAGLEVEEAVRDIEQGGPDLEGGVDLEGVGPVVLEDGEK